MPDGDIPDSGEIAPAGPDSATPISDAGSADANDGFVPENCSGGEVRVIIEVLSGGNAGNQVGVNGLPCRAQTTADATCQFCIPQDTPVNMLAVPAGQDSFVGYSGGSYGLCPCSSSPPKNSCSDSDASAISCAAEFAPSF